MRRLPKPSSLLRPNRGTLLVVVIGVLAMFSILGVGVSRMTAAHLEMAKRIEERPVSDALARAALQYALIERAHDATAYDTLGEFAVVREKTLGRGAFHYTMEDESGKINLNTVPQNLLARLPGFDLDAAVAITTSKYRPFHRFEELQLLVHDDDLDAEQVDQARPLLTVFGDGKVNLNTASDDVLRALGMDDSLISTIRNYQAGKDGHVGTEDDQAFTDAGALLQELRDFTGLMAAQEAVLVQLTSQGLLGVKSSVVRLQVRTTILGKQARSY